ncbi:hypothetical protein [Microbulbifer taiwanensis]|uniref:Uncharacterized protein n=1 Tax=Microbulbifer taiwanensis TaxID=986746 RepID=A0ABW1YKJ0_9GAMM|nr:hypothetical protein [Microbulbifer taiwanensis]
MESCLEQRLVSLRLEQEKGRQTLAELDNKRARLTETLLRIEGALAVLQELRAGDSVGPGDEPGSNPNTHREVLPAGAGVSV